MEYTNVVLTEQGMKQVLYIIGFIVLIIVSRRVMSKVKDIPEEDLANLPEDSEEELLDDSEEDEWSENEENNREE